MNNNTTKTKKQIIKEQLQEFAQVLKDHGFTVLVSKTHPFEWLHFEKNGRFATVQPDGFNGYNYGTDHLPCKEHGTGFSTDRGEYLSIEFANNALQAKGWVNYNHSNIKYYKDVDHFINSYNNKWAEYFIF